MLVFILATHYDGEEPDDARPFFSFLRAGRFDQFFDGRKVVVFGLGDSNYSTFNQFALSVQKALEILRVELSGNQFGPGGLHRRVKESNHRRLYGLESEGDSGAWANPASFDGSSSPKFP